MKGSLTLRNAQGLAVDRQVGAARLGAGGLQQVSVTTECCLHRAVVHAARSIADGSAPPHRRPQARFRRPRYTLMKVGMVGYELPLTTARMENGGTCGNG